MKTFFISLLLPFMIAHSSATYANKNKSSRHTVIAHRGYWNVPGSFENSISSLRNAASLNIYGCEFDVNLTADDSVVVVHGPKHPTCPETPVQQTTFQTIRNMLLPNGETIPTLREYLQANIASPKIRYILEIKSHENTERERKIVREITATVKNMGIEKRVEYISFSWFVCMELKRTVPEASVYYLNGDKTPAELNAAGLSGPDYHYSVFYKHPEWIEEAHKLGMKVNTWTIDKETDMHALLDAGVDYITTNEPERLITVLSERNARKGKAE